MPLEAVSRGRLFRRFLLVFPVRLSGLIKTKLGRDIRDQLDRDVSALLRECGQEKKIAERIDLARYAVGCKG